MTRSPMSAARLLKQCAKKMDPGHFCANRAATEKMPMEAGQFRAVGDGYVDVKLELKGGNGAFADASGEVSEATRDSANAELMEGEILSSGHIRAVGGEYVDAKFAPKEGEGAFVEGRCEVLEAKREAAMEGRPSFLTSRPTARPASGCVCHRSRRLRPSPNPRRRRARSEVASRSVTAPGATNTLWVFFVGPSRRVAKTGGSPVAIRALKHLLVQYMSTA